MTEKAQRIAIAKAYGWRRVNHPFVEWVSPSGISGPGMILPDYLNDLNAMREALAAQIQGRNTMFPVLFVRALMKVLHLCPPAHAQNEAEVFAQLHATAAQWAEAFLRALNLWDDSK